MNIQTHLIIQKSEYVPQHSILAHQSAAARDNAVLYLPSESGIRDFLYMTYANVKQMNCSAWMNLTSLWFSLHRGKPEITTVKQSQVRLQGFVGQYDMQAAPAGR